MSNSLDKFISFQMKVKVYGGIVVMVGVIIFMTMKAYYDRNHTVFDNNLARKTAQVMVLADQRIDAANHAIQFNCGSFSLSSDAPDDPVACDAAKKELQLAMADKIKVQANADYELSQGVQVKSYYDGLLASIKQKPLPFFLFAGIGVVVIILACYGFSLFADKRNASLMSGKISG